ncbi:lactonase family protein [Schlesneria paludicola]|uniref:lactonase family protein n=1 Tax=Schlesneria paludicola TaxID=360056 RepID=UPI00058EDA68|nr:lactonase family protein [Schlesneria paludicola]
MNRHHLGWIIALTALFSLPVPVQAQVGGKVRVYFGTFSSDLSSGIYLSTLDLERGTLTPAELAVEAASPSFLAIHPTNKFLYAVSEITTSEGKGERGVGAFLIEPNTGRLTLLNQQPSTGAGPCHLVVDGVGKNVLVANYGGGSVAVLPIRDDGHLSPASSSIQHQGKSVNPERQEAPHAHSINVDRASKFAFAADLGLDKILIYQFDSANGKLTPNNPPAGVVAPGSGPRHFAFHPTGRYAFVNNELNSTVTSFAYDPAHGSLTAIQTTSTVPQPIPNNYTAETVAHPSGKFVYVSNRGHDSLAIFGVDEKTGRLTALGHQPTGGNTPRNFNIDPSGRYILAANQDTNNVVVFRIDSQTGLLSPTGSSITVGRPVCVRFMPLGQ